MPAAKPAKTTAAIDLMSTFDPAEPRFDVPGAARELALCQGFVYRELAAGNIAHLRLGNRILIPRSAIDAYLLSKFKPAKRA
jgi:excisionase family DNA binding protein